MGDDVLGKPYGLTAYKDESGTIQMFVTDDYEHPEGQEPPADFYTKRIKHFSLKVEDGELVSAELVKTFGEAEGLGRLFKVESILADTEKGVLYISDEKGPTPGIKLYDMEGNFTGKTVDTSAFKGEAEGIAIHGEYLITTDQQPNVTMFHLYKRDSLEHVLAFRGNKTTNTDGIAITTVAMEGFPSGALYAIHDDQALSCFNWDDVLAQIK